jgi:hypothetical protein
MSSDRFACIEYNITNSSCHFRPFIQDSVLFRVRFRQVYTGFCFIQGSVQTGLYRILFYSGFGSDRFIQDSVLFRRILYKPV